MHKRLIGYYMGCRGSWCMHFSSFMMPGGNHGVTHPTREWRSPDSAGLGEEQTAPSGPESVAQALDVVELD